MSIHGEQSFAKHGFYRKDGVRGALTLKDPVGSVGLLSTSSAYVTFHLMSLSLALVCMLLVVTATTLYVIGLLPKRGKYHLAAPFFGVLFILNVLERRGVDIDIKIVIYVIAAILLAFALALKTAGA